MMDGAFGICRLATVPIRKAPSDASEMISQLLFGEHYRVVERDKEQKWIKIQNEYDAYEGWIDKKQHEPISSDFFDQINNSDYQVCTDPIAELHFKSQQYLVSMGSVLPLLSDSLFNQEEEISFNGKAKPIYGSLTRGAMLDMAKSLLNTPYYWGGRSAFGIDCSGFTQLIYRLCGYKLPRDSSQQILKGEKIELNDTEAGDLAFFTNQKGKMNHVGLVIDKHQIIHASGQVRIDKLDSNGIFNDEQKEYTHHLFMVKRYLPLAQ